MALRSVWLRIIIKKRSLLFLPLLSCACWWLGCRIYLVSNEPLYPFAVPTQDPESHVAQIPRTDRSKLPALQLNRSDISLSPNEYHDNLFYFIHISDIHVSIFRKKGALQYLKHFLRDILPMVDPAFVLVTGDLTDAKDDWKLSSQQYQEEWIAYHHALEEAGILKRKDYWWDQRGNHDCFDVAEWQSHANYFKDFSAVKQEQYAFKFTQPFGTYSFISLDACPIRGPGRPFNFFGYFDTHDMDYLEQRLKVYDANSNHTFLMSHYPLSTTVTGMSSSGKTFSELAQYFSVFLCGHLHRLALGLGNVLHANHPEGFVELELGDLKQHGNFRVMAVDHDLISFVDLTFLNPKSHQPDTAPVVLITNPKDARYMVAKHEPLERMLTSTHIRFLLFNTSAIRHFTARIDETVLTEKPKVALFRNSKRKQTSGHLFTIPWAPKKYFDGQSHSLVVHVEDEQGRIGEHHVLFRLDFKTEPIRGPGVFVMTSRITYWSKMLFLMTYSFVTVFLLFIPKMLSSFLYATKQYHRWRLQYSAKLIQMDSPVPIPLPPVTSLLSVLLRVKLLAYLRCKLAVYDFKYFLHASLFRLVTLASIPRTFYPMYFYALYIVVGPYFIGELVPSSLKHELYNPNHHKFGFMYVYGMYIDGHWIPLLDTWIFGFLELAYILLPLVLYLSFCITPPEQLYAPFKTLTAEEKRNVFFFPARHERRLYPLHRNIHVRLLVAATVLYQLVNCFFISIFYGPMAVILSPGKTWFVLWSCWALWRHRWSEKGVYVDLLTDEKSPKVGR